MNATNRMPLHLGLSGRPLSFPQPAGRFLESARQVRARQGVAGIRRWATLAGATLAGFEQGIASSGLRSAGHSVQHRCRPYPPFSISSMSDVIVVARASARFWMMPSVGMRSPRSSMPMRSNPPGGGGPMFNHHGGEYAAGDVSTAANSLMRRSTRGMRING
jgi:hypothetical protein